MLANSIAEMRTYGEGFIIADQSPGLLDMSVIRNTNTKIILRLPDKSDRELVGYAAGLCEDQIDELSKLKRGVAAIYQNDWVEPVLVQVSRCEITETLYAFKGETQNTDVSALHTQLLNFLIQGRLNEKLDFSVTEIEDGLDNLGLSALDYEFVEEQLAEYKNTGSLSVWKDENFRRLSRRVIGILGVRNQVENCVVTAADNSELSGMLADIIHQFLPKAPESQVIALSQCMMKDMSVQQEELDVRQQIYWNWVESVKERGMRL